MENIKRIHHISAIVGDAQENLDFYRDVLGLELIKQTVNFDERPWCLSFIFLKRR